MSDWVDRQLRARGVRNERILEAVRAVPREEFVAAQFRGEAYADYPLPIGHGQTISQPYIVAAMTELVDPRETSRILEIGTGSGYQTAVLARLAGEVYSVEVVGDLLAGAAERLARLGYRNVHLKRGNGYHGWPEHAPYDGIIVTAAPDHVPPPLKEQLAEGGRLVIPVGPVGDVQVLWCIVRRGDRFDARRITDVAFVPLRGGE